MRNFFITINRFKPSGGIIELPFKIGDIVTVKSYGGTYSSYLEAFRYFNVEKYCEIQNDWPSLNVPSNVDNKTLWKVKGFAIHENSPEVLCLIESQDGQHLVIDANFLKIYKSCMSQIIKNANNNYIIQDLSMCKNNIL